MPSRFELGNGYAARSPIQMYTLRNSMRHSSARTRVRVLSAFFVSLFVVTGAAAELPAAQHDASLNQYAGNYRVSADSWFLISLSDHHLAYIDTSDDTSEDLNERSDGQYESDESHSLVRFLRDQNGKVDNLTFTAAGKEPVTARKVPFREQEIEATVDGASIRGTLLMPESASPLPALIIVGGSGWHVRGEMIAFARLLATRGYASVIYDRRGWGRSTGKRASGFEEWANDLSALAVALQKNSRIDTVKIGAWGFSQAGWVVTLAASQSHVLSYVVLFAPALTFPFRQEEEMTIRTLKADGQSPQEIDEALELVHAKLEYAQSRQGWEKYSNLRQRLSTRPWFRLINAPEQMDNPEFQVLASDSHYNSLSALSKLRIPVLALAGEFDVAAPPEQNFPLLEQGVALAQNKKLQMHVIRNANHPLLYVKSAKPFDFIPPVRHAPGVWEDFFSWLKDTAPTR
jgi:pimeloyl-ACP methyl ester carboxylesterase